MRGDIKLAGLDYRSASVEAREKFAFTKARRSEFLRDVASCVDEAVLISTCNRTELVVVGTAEPGELLNRRCGAGRFFALRGEEAVKRIFEIACGLHSQIPLEDQILGQMKEALAASREAHTAGALLGQLFQRAVTVGKEIRTKYKTAPHERSAAAVAASVAAEYFKSLDGINALVIGSGEMGMLAAALLAERGANVKMTLRRRRKDGAKPPSGVETIPFDDRYAALRESSVVICATASPHFVLTASETPDDGRKRVMIDLAVPRDIEPETANKENVILIDMDGLGCSATPEELLSEIRESVSRGAKRFLEWREIHDCMPYINEIRAFAEEETIRELGGAVEEEKIREAVRNMTNKLLFTLKERVDFNMAKECYMALAKAARKE